MLILCAKKISCGAGSTDPTYSALSPSKYTQKTGITYAGPGDCLHPIQQPPCTGTKSCGSGCQYCYQGGQSTTGPDTCKRFKAPGVRACALGIRSLRAHGTWMREASSAESNALAACSQADPANGPTTSLLSGTNQYGVTGLNTIGEDGTDHDLHAVAHPCLTCRT